MLPSRLALTVPRQRRKHHLGFSGDGRHVADFLGAQRVDDGTLAHVGVTDEAHADLFLVRVELREDEERDGKKSPFPVERKPYSRVEGRFAALPCQTAGGAG